VAPSDLTAYFRSMSLPATTQLRLQERTVSSLKTLRYDDASSRASTASALRGIQTELSRLAPTVTSIRAPAGLAQVGASQAKAVQQLSVAIGVLADGLTADPSVRTARLEQARSLAQQAEAEMRSSSALASAAATGVAAAAVATIPVVGPTIAAALASIAAVIALIGTIAAQSQGGQAAPTGRVTEVTATKSRGVRWPP
jgi:hypothetical protein